MKKIIFVTVFGLSTFALAQEHLAGLTLSNRTGILSTEINPAELATLSNKFEINVFGTSFNVANNKIGFSDLTSDKDLEDMLFTGSDPVNMRINAEIYGPGLAVKYHNWAFGFGSKANARLDIVDVDVKLGDAIKNSDLAGILTSTTISNNYNQRINGTVWGEFNLFVARKLLEKKNHSLQAGATVKLLFPGSYANMGADRFNGTIVQAAGQGYLTNTNASVNFSYSGGLASSYSSFEDYADKVYGGLNGIGLDLGISYQLKDDKALNDAITNDKSNKNKYKLNAGIALRNLGSMTFDDSNNESRNYTLTIEGAESLNLNQFENVESLQEVETILLNSGYLTQTSEKKDFKVNLPTTLTVYADVKVIPGIFVSGLLQQRINENNQNDQITAQNIFTVTPRLNLGFFETYIPFTNSDVSGFNTGIGFRLGGFYIGSGSVITALLNDSKQADIYTGFRWAFM